MGPAVDLESVCFVLYGTRLVHIGCCIFCISLPPFLHPVCCVAISAFRNALRRSLLPSKRYTAIFCYNSPSWRQPQQLRQRLIPRHRIQSSGASTRSVSTTSNAPNARLAVALAYASTTSSAPIAGLVDPDTVCTTGSATFAGNVRAPASASMGMYAISASPVAASAFVCTISTATIAPSVRTSRALWKDAHSSATVSAQPKSYWNTCAPSTAASPKPSQNPRN